jgi:predicted secreted protein
MFKIAVNLLAVVLFLSSACAAWAAPRVIIDGTLLSFDQEPVIEHGRVLVPLRAVSETLGAVVDWDGAARTITITKALETVVVTVGVKTASINGIPVELDVPPRILNGRTLVPLRFVSEALGAVVRWNGDTQTVTVATKGNTLAAVKLTEADAGRTVDLKEGDVLEVVLEGNPTTGYNWGVKFPLSSILTQVGDPMFQPDTDLTGSGGKIIFRFTASAPGQTPLKLLYQRWWEKDIPPLDEFEVTVRVK